MADIKYYFGLKGKHCGKLFKYNDKVASILKKRKAIEDYSIEKHGTAEAIMKKLIKDKGKKELKQG